MTRLVKGLDSSVEENFAKYVVFAKVFVAVRSVSELNVVITLSVELVK